MDKHIVIVRWTEGRLLSIAFASHNKNFPANLWNEPRPNTNRPCISSWERWFRADCKSSLPSSRCPPRWSESSCKDGASSDCHMRSRRAESSLGISCLKWKILENYISDSVQKKSTIVLEDFGWSARQPATENEGSVVELIGDNQRMLNTSIKFHFLREVNRPYRQDKAHSSS